MSITITLDDDQVESVIEQELNELRDDLVKNKVVMKDFFDSPDDIKAFKNAVEHVLWWYSA